MSAGPIAGLNDGSEVRQTFADDMFLRRHRGLAAPVVNQFVWRFEAPLPEGAAEAFAAGLAAGSLGRRAQCSGLPGARGRWTAEPTIPQVSAAVRPLGESEIRGWVDAAAAVDLDPAAGPGWRLATAATADGGTVVSLVVAHAVADGSAMIDAVVRAASGVAPLAVPSSREGIARWRADARDLAEQSGEILRWGAVTARRALGRAPAPTPGSEPAPPAAPPAPRILPTDSSDWASTWVVADLDAIAIEKAARERGGTLNAWFVAVAAGLVRRTGRYDGDGAEVPVALPVSTRGTDDLRGNATRIARVRVAAATLADQRLDRIREDAKLAYAALADAREPLPLALVQMLPDALVRRLPPPPAAAALASNVGALPDAFATLGGVTATSVSAIAHQQGLGVAEAAATGGGLILFLVRTGDVLSLTVVGCDPFAIADRDALLDLVRAEVATWQLPGGDDPVLRIW